LILRFKIVVVHGNNEGLGPKGWLGSKRGKELKFGPFWGIERRLGAIGLSRVEMPGIQ
jgi:hypothetical protein